MVTYTCHSHFNENTPEMIYTEWSPDGKELSYTRWQTIGDAICANDSCMMLFVPDNDPICAKAVKVVGVAFLSVYLFIRAQFLHMTMCSTVHYKL